MRYLKAVRFLVAVAILPAAALAQIVSQQLILGQPAEIAFTKEANGEAKASVALRVAVDAQGKPLKTSCDLPLSGWVLNPISGAKFDDTGAKLEVFAQLAPIEITYKSFDPPKVTLVCKASDGKSMATIITPKPAAQAAPSATSTSSVTLPVRHASSTSTNAQPPAGAFILRYGLPIVLGAILLYLLLSNVFPRMRFWELRIHLKEPTDEVLKLQADQQSQVLIEMPPSYEVKITQLPKQVAASIKDGNRDRNKYLVWLSLASSPQENWAGRIEFTISGRFFQRSRKIRLFAWWEAETRPTVEQKIPVDLRAQANQKSRVQQDLPLPKTPAKGWEPGNSGNEIRGEILGLRSLVGQQQTALGRLESILSEIREPVVNLAQDQATTNVPHQIDQLTKIVEGLRGKFSEDYQQLSDSLYLKFNQAFAKGAQQIADQVKSESDAQLKLMADLMKPLRIPENRGPANDGRENGSPQLASFENFASEKVINGDVVTLVRLFADPIPGDFNLRQQAHNLAELAATVAEIENRFTAAGAKPPALASQIRGHLLRLEWLAQKYDSFRRNHSLPVEVRLDCTEVGIVKLPHRLAEGLKMALQYWQAPKEFFEKTLDQVVARELTELVRVCDDTAQQQLQNARFFDDLLRKLFELTGLEDVSPRLGGAYDSNRHDLLGFESGSRDTITRVVIRGFRYKQVLLQKPTVMVGQ